MPKYSNKYKLPSSIIHAIDQFREDYTGGGSDISASGITRSPREFWLTKRHWDEIEIDYSDELWSLVGSAVHLILEQAQRRSGEKGVLVEDRLYKQIGPYLFSGQFDRMLVTEGELQDYKFTGAFSIKGETKDEWTAQQNCLRLLLHEAGFEIKRATIQAILRDWGKKKAKRDKTLPPCGHKEVEIELWSLEETERFLEDRVNYIFSFKDTPDDDLPLCTYKEKWNDGDKWKIMERGKKRSLKNHNDELSARSHAANLTAQGRKVKVVLEKGENTKCVDGYCKAYAFCNQAREENDS